jgi:hypothetical protein
MNDAERKMAIASLMATRETLHAGIAQIEASLVILGVPMELSAPEVCPHPAEGIEDLATTLGAEGPYRCSSCGHTQDHPFPE